MGVYLNKRMIPGKHLKILVHRLEFLFDMGGKCVPIFLFDIVTGDWYLSILNSTDFYGEDYKHASNILNVLPWELTKISSNDVNATKCYS